MYNWPPKFNRAIIITCTDINEIPAAVALSNTPESVSVANTQLKIATFNLFNYLEPPNAFYDFDRI